jgi:hypothetical protein
VTEAHEDQVHPTEAALRDYFLQGDLTSKGSTTSQNSTSTWRPSIQHMSLGDIADLNHNMLSLGLKSHGYFTMQL